MLFIWHEFWQTPRCIALQGGSDDKEREGGRERERGAGREKDKLDVRVKRREWRKRYIIRSLEQQPLPETCTCWVQCVFAEDKPPITRHLVIL